jgi:superfamily II DNA/RNA helicase
MMSFTELNLNANISKAILACGYTKPTPIQSRSIPDILNRKDLVASAQTGTGKTAAFVLPALHLLSEAKAPNAKPRVLILTPTRELAIQIMDAVAKYSKFMRINMVSLVGGMPYRQQLKGLSRAVDIIVATPGRLIDHMENRRLDLSGIQMLILDEADRMLDMGFIDDVKQIAKATPSNRQTLLFSATVDNKLSAIIKQLLKDPIRIDLSQEKMAPISIKQEVYMADSVQHKIKLLQHFVKNGNIFKAIIFSATKVNADKLTKQLDGEGYSVAALHGDLKQNMRNRTIDSMRRGKIQFLIATDVAARGIDISDITHVINFDLPKFHEDYVHRIGRTGRAGKSGIAISFASPEDGRHLQGIERFIGQKLELSAVTGLESTKNFNFGAPKKKRGRNSKPGFKSNGYRGKGASTGGNGKNKNGSFSFRSDSPRSEGRGERTKSSSFRSDSPRSEGRGERTRSSSFRSDSPRSEGKGERTRSSSFRSDSPRSEGRGERARSSSFRSDSPRSEGRGERARSSNFRSDSPRSEGRGERTRSSSFRSDSPRTAGRGERTRSSTFKDKNPKKKYFKDNNSRDDRF